MTNMEFQQGAYNINDHNYSEWPDAKLRERKEYITQRLQGTEILIGEKATASFLKELSQVAFEINMRQVEETGQPLIAHFNPDAHDWTTPNESEIDSVAA